MTKFLSYFFYNYFGDDMKVYIEVVIIINFIIDFILLFGVCLILRRQTNLKRLILSSLVGSLTIISMFYNVSGVLLFTIKLFTSLLMVIICCKFKSIKYTIKNIFYLYTLSIILGGTIYLISIELIKKYKELSFLSNGVYTNFVVLLIASPVIIYIYIKQIKQMKNTYSNYYNIDIYLKDKTKTSLTGYLDTGNHLTDPYKNRPIILVNKDKIKINYDNFLLVPYDTLNNHGLLKCIIPDKIYIDDVGIKTNFLIGISEESINIEGVDCILHSSLMERTII